MEENRSCHLLDHNRGDREGTQPVFQPNTESLGYRKGTESFRLGPSQKPLQPKDRKPFSVYGTLTLMLPKPMRWQQHQQHKKHQRKQQQQHSLQQAVQMSLKL